MDPRMFCERLVERISGEEWEMLKRGDSRLHINAHNRETLLEMRDGPVLGTGAVDEHAVAALESHLGDYLDEYMAEAPEGHKWIVVASLYLAFAAQRPLHSLERAGVEVARRGDKTVYRCPAKVPGDNLICDTCVCEPLEHS